MAWERIYELETNYYHPDLLEFFSNRYPDYPNKQQLAEDMRLSKLQLYPFQDSSSAFDGYGYANEEGDWVIPPRSNFEEPSLFSQGYAVNLEREPGPYDVLEEGENYLEDLHKLDLFITKEWTNGMVLSFKGENLTNEIVEIVPGYDSFGRQYHLTLDYKW